MNVETCGHCREPFVESHTNYTPKKRMIKRENEAPEIVSFCTDSCFEGYDQRLTDPEGHNIKLLGVQDSFKEGFKVRKFVCLICMKSYDVEEIVKPLNQEVTK